MQSIEGDFYFYWMCNASVLPQIANAQTEQSNQWVIKHRMENEEAVELSQSDHE